MTLLLFQSTHDVINAEKNIRAEGIACQVIPVPRKISSQCGMAIKTESGDAKRIERLLKTRQIDVKIYENEI